MSHYNKNYFDWHKNIGAFGGKANLFKFKDFVKKKDKIIDFGCGGGNLLANIECKEKIGIEINPEARLNAKKLGIKCVSKSSEINDEWADIIISNHALEHVARPLDQLKTLYKKLKKGGTIIFVVPHELDNPWVPNDVNQHLYTWSSMNLGNLFSKAGFKVQKVETLKHSWPKNNYLFIYKNFGERIFHLICRVNGLTNKSANQIRIIATK